jgi:RNA recognition motif-containing protein
VVLWYGQHRGYGFIEFEEQKAAVAAIEVR